MRRSTISLGLYSIVKRRRYQTAWTMCRAVTEELKSQPRALLVGIESDMPLFR